MTQADETLAAHGGGHHERPGLAHHFDTPRQQFESGKLGMWLFLATEVLFFAGLFCAYAIYRRNHPEVFFFAHHLLDTKLGAINTCVLLFSSLTMAWAVRCAQLGQQTGLRILLALTLACAFGFLGIKYVEYSHKYHYGYLWGEHYKPKAHHGGAHGDEHDDAHAAESDGAAHGEAGSSEADPGAVVDTPPAAAAETANPDAPKILPAPAGPSGLAEYAEAPLDEHKAEPRYVANFFAIYFAMTGLHGVHVVAGMVVLVWLLVRSFKGHFGPDYFTPVDLGGLYWHLVDLIWIFLFPLLYLIH